MRCPTCSDTPHPGFIAWREVEGRDGVCWRDLRSCPDCGDRATAEAIQRALETLASSSPTAMNQG
jgi:hypothetical protein